LSLGLPPPYIEYSLIKIYFKKTKDWCDLIHIFKNICWLFSHKEVLHHSSLLFPGKSEIMVKVETFLPLGALPILCWSSIQVSPGLGGVHVSPYGITMDLQGKNDILFLSPNLFP
jgi:hypothetical protein